MTYDNNFEIICVEPLKFLDESMINRVIDDVIDVKLKRKVYVEFHDEEFYRDYFEKGKEILHNYNGDKLVEGFHDLSDDGAEHQLCIIYNDNWIETLVHELVHVLQSDGMGLKWKTLEARIGVERKEDPVEIGAIVAARLYKKMINNEN